MSTCHKSHLPLQVLLDIPYDVKVGSLIPLWNLEIIFLEIKTFQIYQRLYFNLQYVLPECIAICNFQGESFSNSPWNLNSILRSLFKIKWFLLLAILNSSNFNHIFIIAEGKIIQSSYSSHGSIEVPERLLCPCSIPIPL